MSASERGTEAKPLEICLLLGVPGGRNRRKSIELDTCWKVPAAANYCGVCGAQIDCASDQSRSDPTISRNAAAERKALESVLWCSVFITSYHSKAQSRAPNPPTPPPPLHSPDPQPIGGRAISLLCYVCGVIQDELWIMHC